MSAFVSLIGIVIQHMLLAAGSVDQTLEATDLDADLPKFIALKETLESKLMEDETTVRIAQENHARHAGMGEERATVMEDKLKHTMAFLQKTQQTHGMSGRLNTLNRPGQEDELHELENKETADKEGAGPNGGDKDGPNGGGEQNGGGNGNKDGEQNGGGDGDKEEEFYTNAEAKTKELDAAKDGIKMADVLGTSDDALKKGKDTFNAFLHYVGNLERLIGGTWDYNDKIEEIHDAAINNAQSPIVEGNFPEDGQKPIQIILPMEGEMYFDFSCPVLTPKSKQLLEKNLLPRLNNKILKYDGGPNANATKSNKKFLLCIKAKTRNDPNSWGDEAGDCEEQKGKARNEDWDKMNEDEKSIGAMLKARQDYLIDFFNKERDKLSAKATIFFGSPVDLKQVGGDTWGQENPGAKMVLNVFPASANVDANTPCDESMFGGLDQDKPEQLPPQEDRKEIRAIREAQQKGNAKIIDAEED